MGKNKNETNLSRRDFLHAAGVATVALGAGALAVRPKEVGADDLLSKIRNPSGKLEAKPYNVLFILTDQERYLPELTGKGHWPGRDKLARMGTTFENHQVCSMVCTPSRSVIFTGQHVQHTKMFDNTDFPWVDDMSFDLPTIGHMLRDAGYYTSYQGKWHLNHDLHPKIDPENPQLVGRDLMDKYGFSDFTGFGDDIGMVQGGYEYDHFVTATAQTWLRTKAKNLNSKKTPWFLSVCLVNPHDVMFYDTDEPGKDVQRSSKVLAGIQGAPDDKVYKKKWDVPLPASRKQPLKEPGRPMAHYDYQKSHEYLAGVIPSEDRRWRQMQDYYYNCISDSDRSVDTLITELDNLGMLEDTIVILTSDHGELCGAHGMFGKGSTAYQEQNHVPFIIYHPDIPGGRKCEALTSHLDLVPTILGMTGAEKRQKSTVKKALKGHNFSSLLENPEKAPLDVVRNATLYCYNMWAYMDADWLGKVIKSVFSGEKLMLDTMPRPDLQKRSAIRSVFDGRYKYSRYFNSQDHNMPQTLDEIFEANDVELYDLKNDPNEMKNLAYDSRNSELLLAMNEKLNALIDQEVGIDDGSFLPEVEGVNWAFERFDP